MENGNVNTMINIARIIKKHTPGLLSSLSIPRSGAAKK